TDSIQQAQRGRQRYRNTIIDRLPSSSDAFVPLRFVHVPNNQNAADPLDATKRAPSVPDLISYFHNRHNREEEGVSMPLLSDETLRDKERESRREQFEEVRLRMAHFRLNSDAESSVTRYRSKSTPSRGGMWANNGSQNQSGNAKSIARPSSGHYCNNRGTGDVDAGNGETSLIHANLRQLDKADLGNGFRTLRSVDPPDNGFGSSPPSALIDATNETSPGQSPNNILASSSVKSFDGSRRIRTLSGASSEGHAIPEPPPPPPPATEKERLVERERQARLETERARRRHIALLRERQLEENGDDVENEEDSDHGDLGQVSFDGGLQSAPEFVGDNAMILDLPPGNSSVGSSISIPRPPLPPPPATERERLVERERQARLETERARRRHLALQRERQLDEDDCIERNDLTPNDVDRHSLERSENYGSSLMPDSPPDGVATALPQTTEVNSEENSNAPSATSGEYSNHAQTQVQTIDTEANSLSYPMERFIAEGERPSMLPIDTSADASAADNDTATLPYTMELFLAENAVATPNDGTEQSVGGNDINARQANDDSIEPQIVAPTTASLDHETTPVIETPESPIEWGEGVNDLGPPSESVASIIASNEGSLDGEDNVQNIRNDNHVPRVENSWEDNSSPSRTSIVPSHESFDSNPHPSRLTEARMTQLAEVDNASTGNAPPQSVRDEPSESSVVGGLGAFLGHAHSVATQTTVIESVTEASESRGAIAFSDINESAESLNVVRVDSEGSIQTSTSTPGHASSASIEAMPSSDSSDDSDDISHPSSPGISDSLSHSVAPGSHPSSDNISQMPRLTEADVVALAEIDYASIGNAPPHSVRDERLSESSVTERSGRQFGITTPITEISSVDLSDRSENASVEAMPSVHSDNSIEAMPSEHGDRDRMHDSDDEMIVYQASDMGSSASIEALPSIDLEHEAGLFNYGAVNVLHDPLTEEFTTGIDDCEQDIESAPLLSLKREERSLSDHFDSREKATSNEPTPKLIPLLALIMAELPTFVLIVQGSEQLRSLLGVKRYQIVLASLVMVTSILNYS
ncbi:hypothetical protein ACHAXR_007282, partial [Thalassiosira sp. AJA248-18]